MDDDYPPWLTGTAALFATAVGIWSLWCILILFTGGTLPLLGIEVNGSFDVGFLALVIFLGEAFFLYMVYWLGIIILLPVHSLVNALRRPRRPRRPAIGDVMPPIVEVDSACPDGESPKTPPPV
ncbi:hypothetical protein FNQ90_00385 [Streptomyces alkaliphilus]|uniref:Uncharacterized protein n=1 Tax=Streptomyces alkaliphilus TaxID=1472722 RepID=A0A7W3T972_9ACTN|nr:hypothetical protein [Streptomyces alkaliphilus]MBB0242601.1 hypothetical protein [Streptomyces alkaliphilus]